MKRSKIVGLGLAIAMALAPVAANAHGYSYYKYFHHYKHMKVTVPKGPQTGSKSPSVFGIYMASAIGCGTVGLMAGSVGRQMKIEEAEYIVGNCFLPFIGGDLLRQLRIVLNQNNNRGF